MASIRCPKCGLTQLAREQCKSCGESLPSTGPASRTMAAPARSVAPQAPTGEGDSWVLKKHSFTLGRRYTVTGRDGTVRGFAVRSARFWRYTGAALGAVLSAVGVGFGVAWVDPWIEHTAFFTTHSGLVWLVVMPMLMAPIATLLLVARALMPFRHVTVYRDESRGEVLFEAIETTWLPLKETRYLVRAPEGTVLGHVGRDLLSSLLGRTWRCQDETGRTLLTARERGASARRMESLATIAWIALVVALRAATGSRGGGVRGKTSTPLSFRLCAEQSERAVGSVNREVPAMAQLLLYASAPVRDARLVLALALLLDMEEPASA